MEFNDRLKAARKAKGFTLVELGEMVRISQSSLSKLERGETLPMRKTKIALAKALGDNFGDSSLDDEINSADPRPRSRREIAKAMSAKEMVSLKFGGSGESPSRARARALAELLDAELEKETRILKQPLAKEAKTFED